MGHFTEKDRSRRKEQKKSNYFRRKIVIVQYVSECRTLRVFIKSFILIVYGKLVK